MSTTASTSKGKIVLLGMMTKIPVAGAVWGTMHYILGLKRLGYDVYYVEAHAGTPAMLMQNDTDDSSALAAAFIQRVMERFDLGDRWAFHALHDDGRCYGLSEAELRELYRSSELIINYHGSTVPRPEHRQAKRLLYLETDPVELEIELYDRVQKSIDFLAPHTAFVTWGLNYGQPDCKVPLPAGFRFLPTPPVVLTDLWQANGADDGGAFTTIGNWRQPWRSVHYLGETYTWSKDVEFRKFLSLPKHTPQPFELALSSYEAADRAQLEAKGWAVRHAMDFSTDLDAYRDYIQRSRGEFTVAKDQNVRLRSGWFSERSAQYLAAGRPVITQDTGFGSYLPTGDGLFAFSTMDDILQAVDAINGDYKRHAAAARGLAREHLGFDVVLPPLLEAAGV